MITGRFNHTIIETRPSAEEAVYELAQDIASEARIRAQKGQSYTLGLATGSSPLPLYRELIRLHRNEGASFRNVTTFNLDEYLGLSPDSVHSYTYFMREQLFKHLDIPKHQTHLPCGLIAAEKIEGHCQNYEVLIEKAGGIDLQILGIGRSGHIGFNEPPSSLESKTRLINLVPLTRRDAASGFGGEEKVPQRAITMGIATILAARRIVLLAWGENKADIVSRTLSSSPNDELPASFLSLHQDVTFLLDSGAAKKLTISDE